MGIVPLYCCFKDQRPNCILITGLIANLVAMGFLIWGLADLWFKRDGVLAIYIIAFVITCICLVGFILLFIFLNLNRSEGFRIFFSVGKIICKVIMIITFVAFMLIFSAFIILLVDYANEERSRIGKYFPSHEWAAVFVPSLLSLICLPIMFMVANVLYSVFEEIIATPYQGNITQNTVVSTIANQPQPVMQPVVPIAAQPVVQPVLQSSLQSFGPPYIGPVEDPAHLGRPKVTVVPIMD